MDASNDGSESVDQFLARIASLSAKPPVEDAERTKRMEEEMLQARRERQARRAERARSLSPSKTGPTFSLPPSRPAGDSQPQSIGINPPVSLSPSSRAGGLGRMNAISHSRTGSLSPTRTGSTSPTRGGLDSIDVEFSRPLPPPPSDEKTSSSPPATMTSSLSRSGTLSWQQRPTVRGTGSLSVRSRPQSIASIPDFSVPAAATTIHQDTPDEEPSRKDIAASLASKDPAWFRQTADRGVGSAAYRKNEPEAEETAPFTNRGMKLPGMAKEIAPSESARDTDLSRSTSSLPPRSPCFAQDRQAATAAEDLSRSRPSSIVSPSSKLQSLDNPLSKPIELSAPRLTDGSSLGRTGSILSSAGRPPSPTKGLGGFVESAMMKRSDSVSKRWSVQANQGLKRGDSMATSRPPHLSGMSGFSPGHSRASSKDTRAANEGSSSPLSSSRPVSSHGNDVPLSLRDRPLPGPNNEGAGSPRAQSPPEDSNAERKSSQKDRPSTPPQSEAAVARSPSKTMDSRRWSPTKASWLESALNKPESPRIASVKPETPAWKVNLQRSKTEQQGNAGLVDKVPPVKADATSTAAKQASVQKDEKPAVPSKRNITPTHASPASKQERPSEIPAGLEGKESPKPPIVPKPDLSTPSKTPFGKTKPQTPPKTDFRANLRSRATNQSADDGGEPEFKSVFGKLKRTTTQNYVAPDTLKDNIARGKAALNITGGPQKTKHVDEFKESILQKKEAMNAGVASIHKRDDPPTTPEKSAKSVPEAVARRMTLHKTGPSAEKADAKPAAQSEEDMPTSADLVAKQGSWKSTTPAVTQSDVTPSPPIKPRGLRSQPSDIVHEKPKTFQPAPLKAEQAQSRPANEEAEDTSSKTTKDAIGRAGPAQPVQKTANDPSEKPAWKQGTTPSRSVLPSSEDAPSPAATKPTVNSKGSDSSKIAARLNPGLAGLLSRGPSPRPQNDTNSISASTLPHNTSVSSGGVDKGLDELTHMTKGRAKGPKRRAPKSSASSDTKPPTASVEPASEPVAVTLPAASPRPSPLRPEKLTPTAPLDKPSPRKPSPNLAVTRPLDKESDMLQSSDVHTNPQTVETTSKPKSTIAARLWESQGITMPSTALKSAATEPPSKPAAFKRFDVSKDTKEDTSPLSRSDGGQKPSSTSSVMPLSPSKSKLNTPKGPKPAVDSLAKPATITPPHKPAGLGLRLGAAADQRTVAPELTPPPEPELSKKPRVLPPKPSPTKSVSGTRSSAIPRTLEGFFGSLPDGQDVLDFDTQAFLTSQNEASEKTRTLSMQIWEVSGDGKKTPMPPQQEHILFEDSMYLVVHSKQSSSGVKSTDACLWCGDEVGEAAVEDAQLFCRKVARESGTKLEVIKQGKETGDFFQSLGGIVITRRSRSSALYMLCGRKHLGHLAFDEVDFSRSSLCSQYPFLISAKFGKFYLWKGASSSLEDIGCARLIGNDLGLTGEMEEIAEGQEPASFWESFPAGDRQSGSPSGKSRQPVRQPCRLYRVDQDRPKSSGAFWGLRATSPPKQSNKAQLDEITPISQRDLDVNYVHILDTYSEVYVLVGSSAKKAAEFVTAVRVAQEIAVLAPSIQDRSLLPSCHVVLGEPPEEVKSVFRKWVPSRASHSKEQLFVRVEEVIQDLGIIL